VFSGKKEFILIVLYNQSLHIEANHWHP